MVLGSSSEWWVGSFFSTEPSPSSSSSCSRESYILYPHRAGPGREILGSPNPIKYGLDTQHAVVEVNSSCKHTERPLKFFFFLILVLAILMMNYWLLYLCGDPRPTFTSLSLCLNVVSWLKFVTLQAFPPRMRRSTTEGTGSRSWPVVPAHHGLHIPPSWSNVAWKEEFCILVSCWQLRLECGTLL